MERCDHCGLPLSDQGIPGGAEASPAHYCCYGCRMMDEVVGSDEAVAAEERSSEEQGLLYRFFAGALMAGFVMVLSVAISTEYGFGALRQLQHDMGPAHWVLLVAAAPALWLLGVPLLKSAWHDLRRGRLTLHVLFLLGTSSAVAVSAASYLRGTGPIYLETATMLLALYTLGRYLTARAKGRTTRVLGRLLDVPDTTYERLDPDPGAVAGDALRPGDRVRIRAGDVFPVDGRVVTGESFVDESSLTGEARPDAKTAGDAVFAGTANLDGGLTIEVTAVAEERRLARVEQMMRRALERPPRLVSLTNRIMRWLIPAVIVLALATFGTWFSLAGFEKALYAALSVVLITCPCALGLAIPLSLVVALGEAGREGILVRSGQTLLDLERATAVLFDKTGTLSALDTRTVEVVQPHVAFAGAPQSPAPRRAWREDQLLRMAASVEAGTQHALADAVVEEADARGLDVLPTDSVQTMAGKGVVGTVQGDGAAHRVAVGGTALLDALAVSVPPALAKAVADREGGGETVLFIAVDDEVAALLVLREAVRPTAEAGIASLRRQGLALQMVTGDRPAAARRVGQRLGVPVCSAMTPAGKADRVAQLRAKHDAVIMVGDGINDAAVLAEADVGVAMASGARIAMEAADVTLYNPDLRGVAWLTSLADRTGRIIRQNLAWTFGYNAVGLALAVAGLLHPLAAVAVMTLSSALVTWNAFRIKQLPRLAAG
jgi:heavy metal translocating P-type ATPase